LTQAKISAAPKGIEMKYESLPNNENIPVLGLGTWGVGGSTSPRPSRDQEMLSALRRALEMGYTHIDTAEMYADGHTEELIGEVIQDFERENLFITSKVWSSNLHYQNVLKACEGSLRRLGTSYLDLYLIHWPSSNIPFAETFRALNELVKNGKVRHLGVSNFDLAQLKEAQALSNTPIVTNQVPYSVLNRRYARNGVLEYCQNSAILLTAYSPLKGGVRSNARVKRVALQHRVTPAQVALHWLIRQSQVITIPKSTNEQHLRENLAAVEIDLREEDVKTLDGLA
jgi:diketogulonate reductase-like aldo/keto reductase